MNEYSPHYEMAMRGLFQKRSGASEVQKKKELEDRIDRLSLVCMAMWSLMQDKTDLTEADLLERVRMIDMMDGVEDGKATRTISKCQSCGRTMSQRHKKCLYCGAEKLASCAFDKI